MSCLHTPCAPSPVACWKAEAEQARACHKRAHVCVRLWHYQASPLSSSNLACQSLDFPSVRLVIESRGEAWRRVFVHMRSLRARVCVSLSPCIYIYKCSEVYSSCNQCVRSFIFRVFAQRARAHLCACCRETSQDAWRMNKIQAFSLSLLHMHSWRHGLRLPECLAIYKELCPQHEENRKMENNFIHFHWGRLLRASVGLPQNNTP